MYSIDNNIILFCCFYENPHVDGNRCVVAVYILVYICIYEMLIIIILLLQSRSLLKVGYFEADRQRLYITLCSFNWYCIFYRILDTLFHMRPHNTTKVPYFPVVMIPTHTDILENFQNKPFHFWKEPSVTDGGRNLIFVFLKRVRLALILEWFLHNVEKMLSFMLGESIE